MDIADFVAGLPKCELHLHLEGTLEPDLKLALAARNGIDIGQTTVEQVRETYRFDSLASFLAVYYPAMDVLVTEQDFYDLAYAYLTRAAAQNVRYAEVFFDPQVHVGRGVPFESVVRGYHRALQDAERGLGVAGALIMCIVRDLPADSAMATLEAALPYKDLILGLGLDSDERGNPPAKFAEVFSRGRAEGLRLTMHCDIDQQNTTEHIRQALEDIGVERLDHGTNMVENPRLVEIVRQRGLGLTCCPISNRFVTGDTKAPVIAALLRDGIRVTVNSDDPAYFGGYVAENLVTLALAADLTQAELVQLERNAFDVAWLPDDRRAGYLAELDAYAAQAGA
ncbi:adenosine deaminase [Pseudonocardia aurantiaca]|uniref:Adenine deaminase n=1 Tax=Pseudonocardia aurantiaca TaxID=75290 RepID=A0ABW4FNM4_9PSEU